MIVKTAHFSVHVYSGHTQQQKNQSKCGKILFIYGFSLCIRMIRIWINFVKVEYLIYIHYMIKLILPLYVDIPRKTMKPRKISLSRNVWDSTHHAVKTQVKHILQDIINEQLSDYNDPLKAPI